MKISSTRPVVRPVAVRKPVTAQTAATPPVARAPRPVATRLTATVGDRPTFTDAAGFMNHVTKVVAYAQNAQTQLEAVGRAVNAGQAPATDFEAALKTFQEAVTELKALKTAGAKFNAPWWSFGGFKVEKFYQRSGAQAILAYVPPRLNTPEAPQPPQRSFADLIASAERAGKDGVDVKPLLTQAAAAAKTPAEALQVARVSQAVQNDVKYTARLMDQALGKAQTPAEIDAVIEVARQGDQVFDYVWTHKADAYNDTVTAAVKRLAAQAKTFDAVQQVAARSVEVLNDIGYTRGLLNRALGLATTRAQREQVLALARQGDHTFDYVWVHDPMAYDDVIRAVITQFANEAATAADLTKVADLSQGALHDVKFTGNLLNKALQAAKTTAELEAVLAVARKGDHTFDYIWTHDPFAYDDVIRGVLTRLSAQATTPAALTRVAALSQEALHDIPYTSGLLKKALEAATTKAQVEAVLEVARKGDHKFDYIWTHDPKAFLSVLAAGHTKLDQFELRAQVPETPAELRVKFMLQPLPAFASADAYKAYAVKTVAYALTEIDDVKAARSAFAKGEIAKHVLLDAEERLELSLALAKALQAQGSPAGFDAGAFWAKYPLSAIAKEQLG